MKAWRGLKKSMGMERERFNGDYYGRLCDRVNVRSVKQQNAQLFEAV